MTGLGLGLVVASIFWIVKGNSLPPKAQIEAWARDLGMVYRDEVVAYAPAPAGESNTHEEHKQVAVEKANVPQGMVLIEIKAGSTSEQVADLLQRSGVIKDNTLLSRKLEEKGLANRIRAGYYLFKANTPVETVIQRIAGLGF